MKAIKVIMILVVMAVAGFGLMTYGYVLGNRTLSKRIATVASKDINEAGMIALTDTDTGNVKLVKFVEIDAE